MIDSGGHYIADSGETAGRISAQDGLAVDLRDDFNDVIPDLHNHHAIISDSSDHRRKLRSALPKFHFPKHPTADSCMGSDGEESEYRNE